MVRGSKTNMKTRASCTHQHLDAGWVEGDYTNPYIGRWRYSNLHSFLLPEQLFIKASDEMIEWMHSSPGKMPTLISSSLQQARWKPSLPEHGGIWRFWIYTQSVAVEWISTLQLYGIIFSVAAHLLPRLSRFQWATIKASAFFGSWQLGLFSASQFEEGSLIMVYTGRNLGLAGGGSRKVKIGGGSVNVRRSADRDCKILFWGNLLNYLYWNMQA